MNDWIDFTIHPITGYKLPSHEIYQKNKRVQVDRLQIKHRRDWVEDFYVSPKEREKFRVSGIYEKVFGKHY